ncbi:Uncharacterised protein [Dermatophilus congolensis]|uniref:Uncharacterized protein n=1 Tax=Dermatophilus congolensis TaxID=1863 RepID=A0A239VGR6_9MICO|nr:Uncharacterised protein [Dermatophilus congolensis]
MFSDRVSGCCSSLSTHRMLISVEPAFGHFGDPSLDLVCSRSFHSRNHVIGLNSQKSFYQRGIHRRPGTQSSAYCTSPNSQLPTPRRGMQPRTTAGQLACNIWSNTRGAFRLVKNKTKQLRTYVALPTPHTGTYRTINGWTIQPLQFLFQAAHVRTAQLLRLHQETRDIGAPGEGKNQLVGHEQLGINLYILTRCPLFDTCAGCGSCPHRYKPQPLLLPVRRSHRHTLRCLRSSIRTNINSPPSELGRQTSVLPFFTNSQRQLIIRH